MTIVQPKGVHCELDDLLALQHSVKHIMPIKQQRRAAAAGQNRSRQRGRGIEFEEVRHYQAGDDIRAIDWRVSARTGKVHTKLYHEDREKPLLLVIDQRQNMFFGSQRCFKSVYSAYLGALLGWINLRLGDRIGGMILDNRTPVSVPMQRSRRGFLQFLQSLSNANNALKNPFETPSQIETTLNDSLEELLKRAPRGGDVLLISDFYDLDQHCMPRLQQLAKRCHIKCIQVTDPLDVTLSTKGTLALSDGQQRIMVQQADLIRHNVALNERQQQIKGLLDEMGLTTLHLSTQDDLLLTLKQHGSRLFL